MFISILLLLLILTPILIGYYFDYKADPKEFVFVVKGTTLKLMSLLLSAWLYLSLSEEIDKLITSFLGNFN